MTSSPFIVSDDTIRVDAILVAHSGQASHTITLTNAAAEPYCVIYVLATTSNVFLDNSWIADKGLRITGDDDTIDVTVWFSASGA
jgi:hypothetical protein